MHRLPNADVHLIVFHRTDARAQSQLLDVDEEINTHRDSSTRDGEEIDTEGNQSPACGS